MGNAMLSARAVPWTSADFALMFMMWAIMMVGMMLPSATPMILLYTTVNRRRRSQGQAVTPSVIFAAGYLATLSAFSLVATLLPVGTPPRRPPVSNDDDNQCAPGWNDARRGRHLSVDSPQDKLSASLPVPAPFH